VRAHVADHDVRRRERPAQVEDRLLRLDRPALICLVDVQVVQQRFAQVEVAFKLVSFAPR
jgi:hypothetical protein